MMAALLTSVLTAIIVICAIVATIAGLDGGDKHDR